MGNVRTYLYFTVMTVSDATLLPTTFAPVSRLDQIVERPGLNVKDFFFEYSEKTCITHFKCQNMPEHFVIFRANDMITLWEM